MGTMRAAHIPVDHLIAEVAAFPLASESAVALAPISLDPLLDERTAQLWRRAEHIPLATFPSFSLDEMVAIRDRVWFAERTATPLHRYLRRLAAWFLEVSGPVAIPRLRLPPDDRLFGRDHQAYTAIARRALLWLSFALPPDLLLAGLNDGQRGPDRIDLLSPSLEQLLREQGFAETHLHVGAALDFPLLWNLAMRVLAEPTLRADAFQSPGAVFDEGKHLAAWLVRAALARYVLAAFLGQQPRPRDLLHYLHTDFRRQVMPVLGATNFSLLLLALSELEAGHVTAPRARFTLLKALYAQLTGVLSTRPPSRLNAALQVDPIGAFRQTGPSQCAPDVHFVAQALNVLEDGYRQGRDDVQFARLFWQVVRVRALFYRHVVQRPMTPGLQWFIRFYARGQPARGPLGVQTRVESATRLGGMGHGLRSLEIRTSPDRTITANQRYVSQLDRLARSYSGIDRGPLRGSDKEWSFELGIIYHFAKSREGGADSGKPAAHWSGSNADPRILVQGTANPTGYRYARFFAQRRDEAIALAWVLCHWPLSLLVVRRLDVCTDELGVPNWVMTPLLERVRTAAVDGASALQRLYGWAPPPLRTTAHAGEDFVHLLTGLRLVDEAIEHFGLREGDRVGHGMALGIDAKEWARRAGRIAMTREERLFDLVWEWNWYAQQGSAPSRARSVLLQDSIARLSDYMFGEVVSPYALSLLQQDLYDARTLYEAGFPDRRPPPIRRCSPRLLRLCAYLTGRQVFMRGRELIWVDPVAEGETLADLQAALRWKLGARGLTVEVNPTSNLLIGDLGDLAAHPLWRLRPPRGLGDAPPVSICIGSDDPLTFGSSLRQEYQLLSDAMSLAGLSDEEARQWLDRTCACGRENRFTIPRRPAPPLLCLFNVDDPRPLLI